MKIVYASDLHGSEPLLEALAELVLRQRPGVLLIGGDLGPYHSRLASRLEGALPPKKANTAPAQNRWSQVCRAVRWAPVAWDAFFARGRFLQGPLRRFLLRLRRSLPGLVVAHGPGNHDWQGDPAGRWTALLREGLIVELGPRARALADGLSVASFPWAPPSPCLMKDYERRDLERGQPSPCALPLGYRSAGSGPRLVRWSPMLAALPSVERLLAEEPWQPATILMTHAPPAMSGLDLDPLHPQGRAGSQALRRQLVRCPALISLHGHAHEAPLQPEGRWWARVGSTLAVNPGRHERRLHAVLLDSDDPAATLRHTVLDGAPSQEGAR